MRLVGSGMNIGSNDPLSEFNNQLRDGFDFCRKAYALFDSISSQPGGIERIRQRSTRVEKKLLEELLPICRFQLGRCISIRWMDGNQPYDAEFHQTGTYIEKGYIPPIAYLEATCAMHPNEHLIWRLLNEGKPAFAPEGIKKHRGGPVESKAVTFSNNEHVSGFAPLVVSLIREKPKISYPANTSLVVECYLNSLYSRDDWHLLTSTIEQEIQMSPFQEILLINGTTELATPLKLSTA